jgi:hypothetical protein
MMNNKYELDVWPRGLTVKDEVVTLSFNKDNKKPASFWIKAYTKLHMGAVEKYITQQVNQIDIVELGALKTQTFTLNFVQLFVTAVIL